MERYSRDNEIASSPNDASPERRMPDYVDAINRAEAAFRLCWATLTKLKNKELSRADGPELNDFQPVLAQALFDLDRCYRDVIAYRDARIAFKSHLETADFLKSMKEAASAKDALSQATQIGKSIGDAFAWIFYANNQPLLTEHQRHAQIFHMPPGLGGIGELSFLKSIRSDTHFILYHGITSFLRVGDVSFVDIATFNVIGIGELKTEAVSPDSAKVTLHMVGTKDAQRPRIYYHQQTPPSLSKTGRRTKRSKRMSPVRLRTRLHRQMAVISETLSRNASEQSFNLISAYHVRELEDFTNQITSKPIAYVKIGDGLLLAGLLVERGKPLSERLLTKTPISEIIAPAIDLPQRAAEIMNQSRSDNRLAVGSIDTRATWGSLPLFWWHLDTNILEKLYFHELLIMSLYNSVFLAEKLRRAGFIVAEEKKESGVDLQVSITRDGVTAKIENFHHFERLISHQLMKEETVVSGLLEVHTKLPPPTNGPVRVLFDFNFRF